jgi:hypothetical protein
VSQHVIDIRGKAQHLESLVIKVDVHHKPLLKVSELLLLLLLLLCLDNKPILGISQSIWRWSR